MRDNRKNECGMRGLVLCISDEGKFSVHVIVIVVVSQLCETMGVVVCVQGLMSINGLTDKTAGQPTQRPH